MKNFNSKNAIRVLARSWFVLLILSILLIFPISSFAKDPITIFIAGDSTAAIKQPDKRPETGWGEMLQKYFDTAKVKIDDRALN
jgi:lysophospholipase L1-like esterase